MHVEELEIYKLAMDLGDEVWRNVNQWDDFNRDTIGKQLVRSVDSVAANISEGFGRYHFKESNHFNYYARGSLYETKTWLTKSYHRNLLTEEEFNRYMELIKVLGIKLNNYINSIGKTKK
ncbi:MAG: four helix bundle protein [Mariniphaga sp.]|jgi:four helix bundle protein|nr:four helix bundle protein [Mariniphaga sp.]